MRKLKGTSMKIIEILYEVLIWYILLSAGAVSVVIMYVIPKFGCDVLLVAIGMVVIVKFNEYLKNKREK